MQEAQGLSKQVPVGVPMHTPTFSPSLCYAGMHGQGHKVQGTLGTGRRLEGGWLNIGLSSEGMPTKNVTEVPGKEAGMPRRRGQITVKAYCLVGLQ